MIFEPIITSLLVNDMYKFSMGQVIFHQFTSYKTTWTLKLRNADIHFTPEMVEEIKEQIKYYCSLEFQEDELNYLNSILWIKGSYVDFLRIWRPRYEDFEISTDAVCGLSLEAKGTWLNTSMYEIPTLAIVSEVYYRMAHDYNSLIANFKRCTEEKAGLLEPPSAKYYLRAFSEFGLRRRISAEAQEYAVRRFMSLRHSISVFVGTSNVYLAYKLGCKPVGTMAHEYIMCVGQGNHKYNPAYSNWFALDAWVKEYATLNGTALTDTITTDCFLKDFQLTFATLFSGVRHDSGDPMVWGDKMIEHYKSLNIDPMTKTLLFSDSLNFEKATELFWYFRERANVAFGIGTDISGIGKELQELTGIEPLNIVMKVTSCNGQDVAKLSDAPGKCMCKNPEYVEYLKRCIDWRLAHV